MLRLPTLTVLLCLLPALASAQDVPTMDDASFAAQAPTPEAATSYGEASSTRRPPRDRPELDGWRRDAESGLRLRLDV